jgi:hypothetical protein
MRTRRPPTRQGGIRGRNPDRRTGHRAQVRRLASADFVVPEGNDAGLRKSLIGRPGPPFSCHAFLTLSDADGSC